MGTCGAWRQAGLPHRGWSCASVEDLEDLAGECEMCGTAIRYVHHMSHPDVPRTYGAGCVCAGHMEMDYAAPAERERRLKNRAARRARWLQRRWRVSKAGNLYLTVDGRSVGVYRDPYHPAYWKARVGSEFGRLRHDSPDAAKLALFDYLFPARAGAETTESNR